MARILLAPLSALFWVIQVLRRQLYRIGWLSSHRMPVPVVVVGNLTAGGAGKTPLTLALVKWLQEAGFHPGIISRGYGGKAAHPMPVRSDSNPVLVGDEPVLMARRAGCPVWVGRRRAEAGLSLLALHPEVDVLVADDGLQHLALARDLEVVVVDARRGLGNGWLLPAGPLREPQGRLAGVDAVVLNGVKENGSAYPVPAFSMELQGSHLRNLLDEDEVIPVDALNARPVHALAGIGHPQRFFDYLADSGMAVVPHAFPDHHAYSIADLPEGILVMTEKDAVKVAPLVQTLGRRDVWCLAVDAVLEQGLNELILSRLRKSNGSKTA